MLSVKSHIIVAVVDVHNEQTHERRMNERFQPQPSGIVSTSQLTEVRPVSSLGAHPAPTLSPLFHHLEEDGWKKA